MLLGTGLWVIALATPYWLILIPGPELSQIDTPSNLTSSFINRKVVWAYSGIWRKCQLVELYHSNYGESVTSSDIRHNITDHDLRCADGEVGVLDPGYALGPGLSDQGRALGGGGGGAYLA